MRGWLKREPIRLGYQRALARAYTAFARQYPDLNSSLFDQSFLAKEAVPELANQLTRHKHPDPARLAVLWAKSVFPEDSAQAQMWVQDPRIIKAASDLLNWLESELKSEEVFQPLFDSRAIETLPALEAKLDTLTENLRKAFEATLKTASQYDKVTSQIGDVSPGAQVAVGSNIVQNTTNVYNSYFSAAFASLYDLYIRPDAVFQRVKADDFVGREWLTAKLDTWINDPSRKSGAFLLIGEAGVGKTSFLAHLVRERRYLHLFAEQVRGDANVRRALLSLGAQLVSRYRIEPYTEHDRLPQIADSPDFLDRLLRLAAEKLSAGEKVVIVCDALDEAGTAPGGNAFGLPSVLPDGVYLVLSQRPVPGHLHVEFPRNIERLEATGPENLRDVKSYLAAVARRPEIAGQFKAQGYSENTFVRNLAEKSKGNWMYLYYVVDEIRSGKRVPLDLDNLPTGLVGYYAEYWGDWRDGRNGRGEGAAKWDSLYAPLLTTLAAVQEPITFEQLLSWAQVTDSSREARRLVREEWRAFVTVYQEAADSYTLYHTSLRDFFTGRVEIASLPPARDYLVDELRTLTRDAHARIVAYYRKKCDGHWQKLTEMNDFYPLMYLARHLYEATDQVEELYGLIENEAWCKGKRAVFSSHHSYSADIELAIDQAEDQNNLPKLIAYSLTAGTLRSLSTRLPSIVFATLCKLNKLETAFQLVEMITVAEYKAKALGMMSAVLWEMGQVQKARTVSRKALREAEKVIGKVHRARTFAEIGAHVAKANPDFALSVFDYAIHLLWHVEEAFRIEAAKDVISIVASSAKSIPQIQRVLGCGLAIIDNSTDTRDGNGALAKLAGAMAISDPDRADRLFQRAIADSRKIKDTEWKWAEFEIAKELARAGKYDWAMEVATNLVPEEKREGIYKEIASQAALAGDIEKAKEIVNTTNGLAGSDEVDQWLAYHYALDGDIPRALEIAKASTGLQKGWILYSIAEAMSDRNTTPPQELITEAVKEILRGTEERIQRRPRTSWSYVNRWVHVADKLLKFDPQKAEEIIDEVRLDAEFVHPTHSDYGFWQALALIFAEKGRFDLALNVSERLPADQDLGWLPETWELIAGEMTKRGMSEEAKKLSRRISRSGYKALRGYLRSRRKEKNSESNSEFPPEVVSSDIQLQKAKQLLSEAESQRTEEPDMFTDWKPDKLIKDACVLMASAGHFTEARTIAEKIKSGWTKNSVLVSIAAEEFRATGKLPEKFSINGADDAVILARALAERDLKSANSLLSHMLDYITHPVKEEEPDLWASRSKAVGLVILADCFADIGSEELALDAFASACSSIFDDDDPESFMEEEFIPKLKRRDPAFALRLFRKVLRLSRGRDRGAVLLMLATFLPLGSRALDLSVIQETVRLVDSMEDWWEYQDDFPSLRSLSRAQERSSSEQQ